MTYAELVAQIQSYTENEYSTVDVNTFITQAELIGLGEGKNTRDAYRSGQARIPVKGSRGPA